MQHSLYVSTVQIYRANIYPLQAVVTSELHTSGFFFSQVAYNKAVQLVLGAAQEYFDSAASLTDASMDLAR